MRTHYLALVLAELACRVHGTPVEPVVREDVAAPHAPEITPAPALKQPPTRTLEIQRRADIWGAFESGVNSIFSGLGSSIPSYVASGVPNFFQDFPTGDKVQSSLGIDDNQIRALPTQVLNVPPYGNWSNNAWNIRFRGNVYKQPNTSREKLDDLANIFLIGVDIKDLQPSEQDQARNLTSSIFILQQSHQNVSMEIKPAPSVGSGGGATNTNGGAQNINLPTLTTSQGDFDEFVPIQLNGLTPGDRTQSIQRLDLFTNGSQLGNATAYLVPPEGYTVISDIDDILRVTKIYVPKEGLLNSFARPFTPWENMPDIYANWARENRDMHFHYLTTTPEQATRIYMDYIYKTYPAGSFDTRPLNFSDVAATLSIRKYLLDRVFQTFPKRKFVLVGDISNSDIMKDYPRMAKEYPGQVSCILLRNTSATDDQMLFPYNTKEFKDVDQKNYMFFRTTEDLAGIDVGKGGCYNNSVPQNVTFDFQAERLKRGAAGRLGFSTGVTILVSAMAAALLAV
ncbi:hypothetical protein MCOR27_000279 [Pyricularia oryzae]|uniref:Phosphatidate phosphatase APP1 catalytic domain-containing protein n=5 Tax=Pyricularia TaxID=48558 RepID=A0ABQ8NZ19_PYRGI|nr:uncharacterized protein MGG_05165 [Pyricularia oryzae 70-15]ELQ39014.1 hypothetical protein OOU_Y34scaffold00516g49 [Pyricularia oryzae Y34]KAH8848083.1 hypothetical protein MCOR01_001474 [Pyricularia oryzae]KAI6304197.1 hypothetical protein MCOR33_000711 [Pyricularia grisea]EHA52894.1 hypothetical protein MGG_05165 [Pyricularia oryzae 70-15]KAH9429982.1 hypothetical protein MCOR02_009704 [Pyricularia oryzae]